MIRSMTENPVNACGRMPIRVYCCQPEFYSWICCNGLKYRKGIDGVCIGTAIVFIENFYGIEHLGIWNIFVSSFVNDVEYHRNDPDGAIIIAGTRHVNI